MSKDSRKKRSRRKAADAAGAADLADVAIRARAGKSVKVAKAGKHGKHGKAAADREAMKLDGASGEDPGPPAEGRSTMQPDMPSDTPHPDDRRGPMDGAAAIAPVTDAMMDHAAHAAAALADGVAHGTIPLERAAADAQDAARDTAQDVAQDMAKSAAELSGRAVEAAGEAAGALSDVATGASEGAVRAAETAARDAGRAVERGTEAARTSLSTSADALAQYNAKVLEAMRSNLAATTELFAALVQAKSMPEALSLNADHVRRQIEALASQGRELATLAQRIAFDAMRPFKGAVDR